MWFIELIFDETYLCLIIMQKYPHYVNAFFVLHFYVCNKIIIVQNSSIILCFLLLFLSRGATSPNGGTRLRRRRTRLCPQLRQCSIAHAFLWHSCGTYWRRGATRIWRQGGRYVNFLSVFSWQRGHICEFLKTFWPF